MRLSVVLLLIHSLIYLLFELLLINPHRLKLLLVSPLYLLYILHQPFHSCSQLLLYLAILCLILH